jgi:Arm domain-containing DNA-binding protein
MSGQAITKSLVDGLEPRGSEYTVWDAKLPGFGVRVRPTGAMSFIVVYRAGTGRTAPFRRFTVGAVGKIAPDAARTQAKILLGAIADGADPSAEKRANRPNADQLTFDELAQRYIDEYAKVRKSSWKNDEGYLKRPRAKWKRRIASEITDDDVAELLEEIGAEAPVSANRTQSILHTLFLWAKEPGTWAAISHQIGMSDAPMVASSLASRVLMLMTAHDQMADKADFRLPRCDHFLHALF